MSQLNNGNTVAKFCTLCDAIAKRLCRFKSNSPAVLNSSELFGVPLSMLDELDQLRKLLGIRSPILRIDVLGHVFAPVGEPTIRTIGYNEKMSNFPDISNKLRRQESAPYFIEECIYFSSPWEERKFYQCLALSMRIKPEEAFVKDVKKGCIYVKHDFSFMEEFYKRNDGETSFLKEGKCESVINKIVHHVLEWKQYRPFLEVPLSCESNSHIAKGKACSLNPDGRILVWAGEEYPLTPNGFSVIKILFDAWEKGRPEVSKERLRQTVESNELEDSVMKVFQRRKNGKKFIDPVWDIIETVGKGVYRLVDPGLLLEKNPR